MPPFQQLLIPAPILAEAIDHARSELPRECCGLLAGTRDGRVVRRFPIRNDRMSETEYATNPRDLLDAMKAMRADGLEPLAIYHSHPASAPIPSKKDVADNTWGETVVHLIVGLAGPEPQVRAWWLGEYEFREAEWMVA